MSRSVKLFNLLVLLILFTNAPVAAVELGLGLSAVEEGDNRIRPGIMGHGSYGPWFGRFYHYGREFGPVTERTYIISANRRLSLFKMFGINFLKGAFGVNIMDEQIVVDLPSGSKSEDNFNLGASVGLHGRIPVPGPVFLSASWETHLFLAGEAGIFLANGRKQIISFIAGMSIK